MLTCLQDSSRGLCSVWLGAQSILLSHVSLESGGELQSPQKPCDRVQGCFRVFVLTCGSFLGRIPFIILPQRFPDLGKQDHVDAQFAETAHRESGGGYPCCGSSTPTFLPGRSLSSYSPPSTAEQWELGHVMWPACASVFSSVKWGE